MIFVLAQLVVVTTMTAFIARLPILGRSARLFEQLAPKAVRGTRKEAAAMIVNTVAFGLAAWVGSENGAHMANDDNVDYTLKPQKEEIVTLPCFWGEQPI